MAFYKKTFKKKGYKKKTYKKKYANTSLEKIGTAKRFPMPNSYKTSLRYCQTLTLNSAGGIVVNAFSANSLYDPDVTGVGHQPLGFDQLMPMYDHYTVIGAKITASFVNTDETGIGQMVGIALKDNATPAGTWYNYTEQGNCKYTMITDKAGSKSSTSVTIPCSVGKFMGRHNILSEDDFRGDATHSPGEQVYFHVFAQPYTITDTASVECIVTIDYIAVFSEPKELASS